MEYGLQPHSKVSLRDQKICTRDRTCRVHSVLIHMRIFRLDSLLRMIKKAVRLNGIGGRGEVCANLCHFSSPRVRLLLWFSCERYHAFRFRLKLGEIPLHGYNMEHFIFLYDLEYFGGFVRNVSESARMV
jgi:hypothetical protein